jgi:drug/metabolite transporter (DMT)-like permease
VVVQRSGVMDLQLAHLSAVIGALIGAVHYILVRKTGGVGRMAVMLLYPTLAQIGIMALLVPVVFQPMPIEHVGLTGLMALEAFVGTLCIVWAYRWAPAMVAAPMQ